MRSAMAVAVGDLPSVALLCRVLCPVSYAVSSMLSVCVLHICLRAVLYSILSYALSCPVSYAYACVIIIIVCPQGFLPG
jgi:hypothetical protein